jgi:hypothetical protein
MNDFRWLCPLSSYNKHKVEYIIVGGYALAFHGVPRYTGDIDIFVKSEGENAQHILLALEGFGFGALGLTATDFEGPDQIIQLGFPPVRIDIITSISGVSWDDADPNAVEGRYGDVPVRFIGRQQLILNKRASG